MKISCHLLLLVELDAQVADLQRPVHILHGVVPVLKPSSLNTARNSVFIFSSLRKCIYINQFIYNVLVMSAKCGATGHLDRCGVTTSGRM